MKSPDLTPEQKSTQSILLAHDRFAGNVSSQARMIYRLDQITSSTLALPGRYMAKLCLPPVEGMEEREHMFASWGAGEEVNGQPPLTEINPLRHNSWTHDSERGRYYIQRCTGAGEISLVTRMDGQDNNLRWLSQDMAIRRLHRQFAAYMTAWRVDVALDNHSHHLDSGEGLPGIVGDDWEGEVTIVQWDGTRRWLSYLPLPEVIEVLLAGDIPTVEIPEQRREETMTKRDGTILPWQPLEN